jgi:hypothetical protein
MEGCVKGKGFIGLFILLGGLAAGWRYLPAYYNPFAPLQLNDPPGRITQFKLRGSIRGSALSCCNRQTSSNSSPQHLSPIPGGLSAEQGGTGARFWPGQTQQQFSCQLPAGAQFSALC